MVVAVETDNYLQPIPDYARPPEAEIYGRSLSTIHKLGVLMVGKAVSEATSSPEADQARVEFYTSVEEGFGTDVELGGGLEVRDFDSRSLINGRVMAKDLKTPVSDMTNAGLICAEETAQNDEHFLPQLTRSELDHKNALIVDKMARGETDYNTRIVVSPFPQEAAAKSGDKYWRGIGYVPHLRRGFVQLYHATEKGLITGSLSFDGSDKRRLRMIFSQHGIDIPEGEVTDNWLQYAITDTLSYDQAKVLATEIADEAGDLAYKKITNTVDITHEYRAIMDTVFNELYVHACESLVRGHQTPDVRRLIFQFADKASDFNDHYTGALYRMRANGSEFTDDDMVVLHELLVYSTIEMMRALHLKNSKTLGDSPGLHKSRRLDVSCLQSLDGQNFQHMLSDFGAIGARNNRTYSACGLSISLGETNTLFETTSGNKQDVFGGKFCNKMPKDGDVVKNCPHCSKKNVRVSVEKGELRCDNPKCKKVAAKIIEVTRKHSQSQAKSAAWN